ncbi:MAG: hypothetical protein ThorAB25_03070 [Candidatus Thorarchaeota archaeon AB_25]|nr:MAG: hypothetical protein ThorAB25_03070 [Candidatus Thorarchaeota archaeon AB_25]
MSLFFGNGVGGSTATLSLLEHVIESEGDFQPMSKRIHNTSLTILRSTHLARDAVLFSLFGFFSATYSPGTLETYYFLMWLVIDFVGLFFLWIPRETWQQVGFGWGGLMSIGLLFLVFAYSGNGSLVGGLMVILLLCIIELLAVLKSGYDFLKAEARSWNEDTEFVT